MSTTMFCALFAMPWTAAPAPQETLRYVSRYDYQPSSVDHLMGVESVFGHFALVSSNLAVALVDVDALPQDGTSNFLDRLKGLDAYSTYTRPDGISFVHLRLGGFAVIEVDPFAGQLTLRSTYDEAGVYYEKMAVRGDRLYVAAHSYGLRIFDVSNPDSPKLVGSLPDGLVDAFSVVVDGSLAYVADGTAGLAVVDLTDETAPVLLWHEDRASAVGTSEDLRVVGDFVHVAAGSAGVVTYDRSDLTKRRVVDTPTCAIRLDARDGLVAVADIGGCSVFRVADDGSLLLAASEQAQRRSIRANAVTLRLWHGISLAPSARILTANWDSMDVYDLAGSDDVTNLDLTASTQRIRFPATGGESTISFQNQGSAPLSIPSIRSTSAGFTVEPDHGQLLPGESLDVTVRTAALATEGTLLALSDDPDEQPYPVQLFADTPFLDPEEPAIPFDLESWTFDHDSDQFVHDRFVLEEHTGEIVVFQVFGTW